MSKPEKDIGRLLFSLWCLTNSKPKARIVAKCLDAAIRIAMDHKEFEVAGSLRDLREQLIDVPHGKQGVRSQASAVLTPDQFAEEMKVAENEDPECGHIKADDLMCELLQSLGYGDGVEAFQKMGKWYA